MSTAFASIIFAFIAVLGVYIAWDIRRLNKHKSVTDYPYRGQHAANSAGATGFGAGGDGGGSCGDGGGGGSC